MQVPADGIGIIGCHCVYNLVENLLGEVQDGRVMNAHDGWNIE